MATHSVTINSGKRYQLDEFTYAYLQAALWSSTDNSTESGGYPLDENYELSDLSEER